MDFGETLNRYLDRIGCTAKELAAAAGVSEVQLSRWRTGKQTPSAEQAALLAAGIVALLPEADEESVRDALIASLAESAVDSDRIIRNLNSLTAALNLRSSALARELSFDASYLSRIKSGRRRPANLPEFVDGRFMIGTVKKLEPKYGIDVLLRAAAIFRRKRPDVNLRLMIAGTGTHEEEYKKLAEELGLSERVTWTGFLSQDEAADLWASLDVAVIPSVLDSESFGVSAVEAEASGVPVITSDVPGLMEATRPGYTALTVKRQDPEALAEALIQMYDDPVLRGRLGQNGRKYVQKRYEYKDCFQRIEAYLKEWADRH